MIRSLFDAIATLPHDTTDENGRRVHLQTCRRCLIQRHAMHAHEKVLGMIRTVNELFGEIEKLTKT
jgi:hypothetical protein